MFISGVGGTGKSFLIETIKCFVDSLWKAKPGELSCAIVAPTGLAAFKKLAQVKSQHKSELSVILKAMKELPTKPQGRPVLLGVTLDKAVQEYVTSQREAGAPVNTTILERAIKGI